MSNIKDLQMPQAKFDIGGRERTIKFDLNAFAELEKRFGSVEKAFAEFEKGDIKAIKLVLWAGLIHDEAVINEETGDVEKYNITPFEVGSWIDPITLQNVTKELFRTLDEALPQEKKEELAKKVADLKKAKDLKNDQTTQSEKQ